MKDDEESAEKLRIISTNVLHCAATFWIGIPSIKEMEMNYSA